MNHNENICVADTTKELKRKNNLQTYKNNNKSVQLNIRSK